MTRKPLSVSITLILFLLFALLWLGFGTIVAANAHPALPPEPLIKWIMAAGASIAAAALVFLWLFLKKRNHLAYYVSIGLFVVSAVATFLDDVGWADLIFIGLCLVVLVLLFKDRKWYLQNAVTAAG